ncbi:Wadjet anti-phage system protein JetA family protein [Lachnoclostridium sp. Marseille-P6806]|uniref:Wadjet anti-phage system protein JetA family protein n=1 Tax=Lachnoclostridium sp. Marseille-P6806 TaxID=2364793 RepID=UPI0010304A70|nr:Wadjet anti-phage system protein JetA family protein [Lachnoclostridium sp. Marseille-P6806]
MELFDRVPDKLFTILGSAKKSLYVQALFVLREAFQTELQIWKEDLTAMMMNSLESSMLEADFTEEAEEENEDQSEAVDISGKARLLLRKLKVTGWIDTEYARGSFDEYITIPDYSIAIINLLYSLTEERTREYNSYVYGTYAVLENAERGKSNYLFALQQAYHNTNQLVIELKTLFNNIKRYFQLVERPDQDVNLLLHEHFDEYKSKIIDAVYYPLKTMDSVPRFKNSILEILNEWMDSETIREQIVSDGMKRHVFDSVETGRGETERMLASAIDIYDEIEDMIREIDRKHNEYTNASVDKIRYLINTDQSAKGKLIDLLKNSDNPKVLRDMSEGLRIYQHSYADIQSLYEQARRTRRGEGKPLPIAEPQTNPALVGDFLSDIRRQYTNKKIDRYILDSLSSRNEMQTEDFIITGSEDFILFLLATLRGREQNSPYTVTFHEGNTDADGWNLPNLKFTRKHKEQSAHSTVH